MGDAEDFAEIENVEIIRDMDWALFCRIDRKIRFIPQILLRAGSVRDGGVNADVPRLQRAIRDLHGLDATHLRSERVREMFQGKVAWRARWRCSP